MENEPDKWDTQTWVVPHTIQARIVKRVNKWFLHMLATSVHLNTGVAHGIVEHIGYPDQERVDGWLAWTLPVDAYGVRIVRKKADWFIDIFYGLLIPIDAPVGESLAKAVDEEQTRIGKEELEKRRAARGE